jgi:hypothetical protein
MARNQIHSIFVSAFVLVAALIATRPAAAQDPKQPYPTMAPVEQYLMDRDAEIAIARSAAPELHFARCSSFGSWTSWFRNSGQRQKRFRVYRGAFVDFRS